ncbi:MAG: hypothetical protein ACKVS9_14660 [Phycisphaerae bacterium]
MTVACRTIAACRPREGLFRLAGTGVCQVLLQQNLTLSGNVADTPCVRTATSKPRARNFAAVVRGRIEQAGERIWRLDDFRDLPFTAAAQALSRLAKAGFIERLSKGVYYRSRETSFGKSLPNPATIQKLAARQTSVFPSGLSAASLLGFTTQTSARNELATSALSLPRKLVGQNTVVHARRPEAWAKLSESDAALLDLLRNGFEDSELSDAATIKRVLELLRESGRFGRLLQVASTEPPRVRAVLGALGDELGQRPAALKNLRASLNPFSRFDFGKLAGLRTARSWHAKERRKHEAL